MAFKHNPKWFTSTSDDDDDDQQSIVTLLCAALTMQKCLKVFSLSDCGLSGDRLCRVITALTDRGESAQSLEILELKGCNWDSAEACVGLG